MNKDKLEYIKSVLKTVECETHNKRHAKMCFKAINKLEEIDS